MDLKKFFYIIFSIVILGSCEMFYFLDTNSGSSNIDNNYMLYFDGKYVAKYEDGNSLISFDNDNKSDIYLNLQDFYKNNSTAASPSFLIDELLVYNRDLTSEEIYKLYEKPEVLPSNLESFSTLYSFDGNLQSSSQSYAQYDGENELAFVENGKVGQSLSLNENFPNDKIVFPDVIDVNSDCTINIWVKTATFVDRLHIFSCLWGDVFYSGNSINWVKNLSEYESNNWHMVTLVIVH